MLPRRRNRAGRYEWVRVCARNDLLDAGLFAHACADPQWWGGVKVLPAEAAPVNPSPKQDLPPIYQRRPRLW
jgi:hypothetical protein